MAGFGRAVAWILAIVFVTGMVVGHHGNVTEVCQESTSNGQVYANNCVTEGK